MLKYALTRILWTIPIVLGVVIIVYTISFLSPGDPVLLKISNEYTEEQYAAAAAQMGLDKPYIVQVANYLWNMVTKFDLGKSYNTDAPVTYLLSARIPVSFKLSLANIVIMLAIGLPLGIISALKRYSALDIGLTSLSLFLMAIPSYVLALLGALVFGVILRWLPISGLDTWQAWILPLFCSAGGGIASYTRMSRTTMLEVIKQDYIRTARAKGLNERVIIVKHALKNCLIPLVTMLGAQISRLFSGAIVIETIFAVPGVGLLLRTAITNRDYPVINGCVLVISALVCMANMCVDIAYAFIDPRIKARFTSSKRSKKKIENLLGEKRGAL